MTIGNAELPLMKALVVNNGSTNGGYRSYDEVITGQAQNQFPDVFIAERDSGSTVVRFAWLCNHSINRQIAQNMLAWLDNETDSDDYVYFCPVAQGTTQADLTGTEPLYTVAALKTDVSVGAQSIVVECPTPAAADVFSRNLTDAFVNGRKLMIIGKEYPTSVPGTVESNTIDGAPVVAGTEVTIPLLTPLLNSYLVANDCRVATIYSAGTVIPTADAMTKSSPSGTLNDSVIPPELENDGTIEETWTFTFNGVTTFTCSGARTGALPAGSTLSTYAPINPATGTPYFTILAGLWTGTWASTDHATLVTHDSSKQIAEVRVIPSGAGPMTNNRSTICIACESV